MIYCLATTEYRQVLKCSPSGTFTSPGKWFPFATNTQPSPTISPLYYFSLISLLVLASNLVTTPQLYTDVAPVPTIIHLQAGPISTPGSVGTKIRPDVELIIARLKIWNQWKLYVLVCLWLLSGTIFENRVFKNLLWFSRYVYQFCYLTSGKRS